MGRSTSSLKSILLATRVTPRINELVKQMAYREGLHVSEWIRNVITDELKKNDMLSTGLREPVLKSKQKTRFPLDDM